MKRLALCVSVVGSLVFCSNGLACGDKLLQTGRGVRYQRANAVRPATIAILSGPAVDRRAINRLRTDLSIVGHDVRVLADSESLRVAIESTRFDLVLVDASRVELVSALTAAMAARPIVIPMVAGPAERAPADIERRFPHVMLLSSRAIDQIAVVSRATR